MEDFELSKVIEIPVLGKTFVNNVTNCIGTGRMGLALQKEFVDHLELVQKSIRFKYIRGHGLLCDDVGIYREYKLDGESHTFYNFTYLDRIIDTFQEYGIKPFLELGFMPEKLKTGDQSVFYWNGNVTPPASYEKWADLIRATMGHLVERYGRKEVITWPVEVWNEPNIHFWAGTREEYFRLYEYSARAVKQVDERISVGGPAICGVQTEKWLRGFFEHCIENDLPLDFVSRHCYTANKPIRRGHYTYHTLKEPTYLIEDLKKTKLIMADYSLTSNMPLHITEFNSSYGPTCPIHDTDFHAPYIARILSEIGEYADSYSYWTFSDVFEEADVPKSIFHGGFGLVALNSIKKPTFYAFEFFSKAGDELLYRDDNLVVTKKNDQYVIIGWNLPDMYDGRRTEEEAYHLVLPAIGKQAIMVKKLVGGQQANPLQTWSNLGKPRSLNKQQLDILQAAAEPMQTDAKLVNNDGVYGIDITIACNQLCMVEIVPVVDNTGTYLGIDPKEFHGME